MVLTLSQRETLLEGYKSGVVRYSSVEENAAVDRLAEKAGLTSKRVKVKYIRNVLMQLYFYVN